MFSSARWLEARPGPAAAHRHRGQATPLPTGTAAKPRRSPWASQGPRLARCDFWPISCVLLQTSSIGGVFRVAFCPVVTNVVNPTAFSLKIVVFGRRLTTFVTGVLTRCSKLLRFDDVCNGYCPRVPWTGTAAAHGRCGQALPTRRPGCLKPPSPLRACACVGLKPTSPLRAPAEPRLKPASPLRLRNGCFWCVFRLQWCCWFQWLLFRGVQW